MNYHVSCTDGRISFRFNILFYLFFPPSSHPTVVFLSYRPFVVKEIFSTGLVGVENVLTTKGLQERNTNVGWDDGGKIGKIINYLAVRTLSIRLKLAVYFNVNRGIKFTVNVEGDLVTPN